MNHASLQQASGFFLSLLGDLWRQVYDDVNAPLYYAIAWLWAQASGLSDAALRFPATLFGTIAPLIALAPVGIINSRRRMLWCALLACWIPGIWFSQDARCYTLLFLLGVANAVAFAGLLQRPTAKAAVVWSLVSSLMILTHYYAGLLTALQGLAYLAVHRMRALKTWPAALVFAPTAAWVVLHLPRLAAFAGPEVAWYPLLTLQDLAPSLSFLFGAWAVLVGVALWGGVALIVGRGGGRVDADGRGLDALWVVGGVSLTTAILLIALGFLRPSFSDRYLTPLVPGVLLGLVLLAESLGRRWTLAPTMLIALFITAVAGWAFQAIRTGERVYNFETASRALMTTGATRLVFLWDHPATPIEAPGQLRAVGGFFFRRAGYPIAVEPLILRPGQDPNVALLDRARAPGTVMLWLYDTGVRNTAARQNPQHIAELDPKWKCRDFGKGGIGIVACTQARGDL